MNTERLEKLKDGGEESPEEKDQGECTNVDDLRSQAAGRPLSIIVIGMAGSGKTTFIRRLKSYLKTKKLRPYVVNLDPAVESVNYKPNIDIRDTVDYDGVMKKYGLGPNGGIMASMNLFATKFNEVLDIIERRKNSIDYTIIDTPGQIEVFTWSASGSIMTQCLSASGPTTVVYLIDTPRSSSPITFMSNMLYACSVMYKMRLPFILVFNKVDVVSHQFALNWMNDFEAFHEALQNDHTYMATLSGSMCLVLEEFYRNLRAVGVSSMTGIGMDDFLQTIKESRKEYFDEFLVMFEEKLKKEDLLAKEKREKSLSKLMEDLNLNDPHNVSKKA